ncbi:MAG: SRPBCC family protein [Gammaproteobacteria bacterium]|nr:SRPBCC family protein [Gammaproteobacteria bacterium]MBU2677076.1 SRPBCC family protein [Gammaproteobacteria bacterium]NNC57072.1 SRPBCC family protein [Woeseiaceae bacterium]NNL50807.1 SRPBCC family protein [Woeseiaceae bacterium]
MKHKTEIIIDADRTTVWRMFDDPDNMTKWQPTLLSFTHKSGTPGQPDAISELVYEEKGRKMVMIETVTARRELDFLGGTYESKWGTVVIFNNFEDTDDGKTRWIVNTNYNFRGFMKFMAFFMRKSIRKRTDTDLNRFKLMVETELAGKTS